MADISPTLEKQRKVSLDVYSSIADSFKAIASDLVEYVKLKTGKDITPTVEAPKAEGITTTPTPEVTVKQKKEKDTGLLGKLTDILFKKIISPIKKIFDPAKIMAALAAYGIITNIFSGMFEDFKTSFSDFFSNMWENMKEGFSNIGQWFSNLFDKAGDLISGLWSNVVEFVQPFKDRVVEFFSKIGDYISEKFSSIVDFFGKFNIFGKKEKPKPKVEEVKIEDTLPTVTKGVDEEGFEYTERKAAKKVIKTPEQVEYEKKRDAELAERSKRSREKLRAGKKRVEEREKAEAGQATQIKEKQITKPTQTISGMEDVKAMIIQHEGIRYEPYKDSLGLWTVGVGHLIGDGKSLPPEMNRKFSEQEVMNMFEEDFAHHKKIAENTPGYQQANESGKGAFIDLAFNMGKWWPKWPTTTKLLNEGNFGEAADAMKDSKWYKQVGNRGVTITNLVAQAGTGASAGDSITVASNEVATGKRDLSKSSAPLVVNSSSTTNNTVIKEQVNIQTAKNNTSSISNRVA